MVAIPERSSSPWRRWFSRNGRSATGREKLEGQDCPGVQDGAVGPSAVSAASKDATQISNTTIDVSQPATRCEPISFPLQAPAATSTSSSPLPAARAAISGDVATSTDTHRTASPPERLWDRAYDDLKAAETALLHVYEKILSCNLHKDGFGSAVTESQPNAIVQYDPDTRRRQMEQLVHTGLDKTAREAKVKEGLGPTMDIVLSAKNTISFAIQAMPQAALAWTGVCIVLEVSSSTNGYFTR
jgi:N-terminal domain of NWD NACHT-NTPase